MKEMPDGNTIARRIAVDFGTEQTVIAVLEGGAIQYPDFKGFSRTVHSLSPNGAVPVIPSLISFGDDGGMFIGEEVVTSGRVQSPATVRRMLHYIVNGSPARLDAGPRGLIGYPDASASFLSALLAAVPSYVGSQETEIAFVVPINAGEQYISWLRSIGIKAGAKTVRMVDAITATIYGYGLPAQPGNVFLLVNMEESLHTVTVAAVGIQEAGQSCTSFRVLGKAEDETGSARVDAWIAEDIGRRCHLRGADPRAQNLSGQFLQESGRARERLTAVPDTVIRVPEPLSGISFDVAFSQADLARVLSDHGFLPCLRRTIDRAIAAATGRGHTIDNSIAVLLTGECLTLPCLKKEVIRWFGRENVYGDRASDARVRGALYAVPIAPERITNNYAVRYWDAVAREHRYRFLVRAGTPYPSAGQVGRFLICASYDGQTHLGVPLYSLGTDAGGEETAIELVSDATGGVRICEPLPGLSPERKPIWVNERKPTLLAASPPAARGEARFELTFSIDRDRQLCLTARDLLTGEVVKRETPIFQLI
jgi:molecular chaperone DnaK